MGKKTATKVALLGLCLGLGNTQATEVTWNGSVDADAIRNYGDVSSDETNQEISIGANVKFDENVSLDVRFVSSNGSTPDGDGVPKERWSSVEFDGALLNLQLRENMSVHLGDLVYAEGAFRYFAYHSTGSYAGAFTDTPIRGAAFKWNGFEVAAGVAEESDHTTNSYASYSFAFGAHVIKPYQLFVIAEDGEMIHSTSGLNYSGIIGSHQWNANYACLVNSHSDPTFTMQIEPRLEFGAFAFDASAFYSYIPDVPVTLSVPDEWFLFGEPQWSIHPWVALGISGEVHDINQDSDVTEIWSRTLLHVHVTPTENVNIRLFGGRAWTDEIAYAQAGGEVLAEF